MHDFILMLNILALVCAVYFSYLYTTIMFHRQKSFLLHSAVSLFFIFLTFLATLFVWYYTAFAYDALIYTSGLLVIIIVALFCFAVYIAALHVKRSYFLYQQEKNHY
ncbi:MULTISPECIES: hypothetical protein [Bacillus]|uniref:hypothetical protein n=1 Tax=Bacillus TaxID=1386 RepID=UPI000BB73EDA|nr:MULTISPECIES: hypothetical protein [Bacillus]